LPPLPGPVLDYDQFIAATPYEDELRSGRFGVFKLTRKAGTHQLQAACPFHKKGKHTGCKKTVKFTSDDFDSGLKIVSELLFWCCRALQHNRQVSHMVDWDLDMHDLPVADVIRARMITQLPARPPKTDQELDTELLHASSVGASSSSGAPAASSSSGAQEAVALGRGSARGRARGRGRAGRAAPSGEPEAGAPPAVAASSDSSSSSANSDSSSSDSDSD
jgi:hypothetical protein